MSGVSPALLTGSVEDHHQQRNSTDKHLLFGLTCLLMRALTIFKLPREHSRERGVSPAFTAAFTATVDTSKLWTLENNSLLCSMHTHILGYTDVLERDI